MIRRVLPRIAAGLIASVQATGPSWALDTTRTANATAAPAAPSSHYTPAPVPDETLDPPQARATDVPGTFVTPEVFRLRKTYQGEGYTPGSTVEGEQQKHQKFLPGFNLTVPLE